MCVCERESEIVPAVQFLCQCRERRVQMEPDSLSLLKRYFVASRRVRQDESGMPRKALETL